MPDMPDTSDGAWSRRRWTVDLGAHSDWRSSRRGLYFFPRSLDNQLSQHHDQHGQVSIEQVEDLQNLKILGAARPALGFRCSKAVGSAQGGVEWLKHALQSTIGDGHLGCLTSVRAQAQAIAEHPFEAAIVASASARRLQPEAFDPAMRPRSRIRCRCRSRCAGAVSASRDAPFNWCPEHWCFRRSR